MQIAVTILHLIFSISLIVIGCSSQADVQDCRVLLRRCWDFFWKEQRKDYWCYFR